MKFVLISLCKEIVDSTIKLINGESFANHQTGGTRRKILGVLTLLFPAICMMATPLRATTYFVDASSGNDSNSGILETSAWKTVDHVNGRTFFPGDNILFKRGETWHESLVVPSAGTSSQPITFGAYGTGDRPLLSGTYSNFPIPIQWEHVQGNIYKTTQPSWENDPGILIYNGIAKPSITTLQFTSLIPSALKKGAVLLQKDVHYTNLWVTSTNSHLVSGITFFSLFENENIYVRQLNSQGREIEWPTSLGIPTIVTNQNSLTESGYWYWNQTEKAIYLYTENSPAALDIQLGKLMIGINSAHKNNLVIKDLAITGYTQAGILLTGTEGAVVQDTVVSNIGASGVKCGILLNNSSNCLVQNNKVESVLRVGIGIYAVNAAPFSNGNTVLGNIIINPGSTGISLNTDHPLTAKTVENNTIRNNTILNANALSYDSAGIYCLFIGGGNVIESNTIKNGGNTQLRSSGIMIEGGNNPAIKPVTVINNYIENNSLAGIAVSGKGHMITGNRLYHNGVPSWDNAQISLFASFGENASNCTVTSNTMEAETNQFLVSSLNGYGSGNSHHTINSNIYCSANSEPFCLGGWTCTNPVDFKTWKNQTGYDATSTYNTGICTGSKITSVYLLLL